jgi:hypothetical protein
MQIFVCLLWFIPHHNQLHFSGLLDFLALLDLLRFFALLLKPPSLFRPSTATSIIFACISSLNRGNKTSLTNGIMSGG